MGEEIRGDEAGSGDGSGRSYGEDRGLNMIKIYFMQLKNYQKLITILY